MIDHANSIDEGQKYLHSKPKHLERILPGPSISAKIVVKSSSLTITLIPSGGDSSRFFSSLANCLMTFGGRFSLVAFSVTDMPLESWDTVLLSCNDSLSQHRKSKFFLRTCNAHHGYNGSRMVADSLKNVLLLQLELLL